MDSRSLLSKTPMAYDHVAKDKIIHSTRTSRHALVSGDNQNNHARHGSTKTQNTQIRQQEPKKSKSSRKRKSGPKKRPCPFCNELECNSIVVVVIVLTVRVFFSSSNCSIFEVIKLYEQLQKED
jgi:hypothetical protein